MALGTGHGKLLPIFFYINSFCRPFPLTFCGKSLVGKRKTNCATIISFPQSVVLSTIALYQSAGEKSLSYCKKIIVTNYFITLAKDSCTKNSRFVMFRRFRSSAVCSSSDQLPCEQSFLREGTDQSYPSQNSRKQFCPTFYFAAQGATCRGLGTANKRRSKLQNKFPDKLSSQTLSRQKQVAALGGPQSTVTNILNKRRRNFV